MNAELLSKLNTDALSIEEVKLCIKVAQNLDKKNGSILTKEEILQAVELCVKLEYYEAAAYISEHNPYKPQVKKYMPEDWFTPGVQKLDWNNPEARVISFQL